ncbi:CD44 antigen [Archocentrus centrarchus]|uniref:CD44 antigen n=1 Tax=Archocentrus centrarchus TaxID=63155 RepID=UPI0011EA330D|nr:CD44 antigen [Archocentrus centrarchus]
MWTLILGVIFGLLASSGSESLQVTVRSCSVAGVFRAEGTGRHSLKYDMAIKVCEQQMSTIVTEEQLHEAYNKSLQTCRYGWISNVSIAIIRQQAHENCSKSMTGVIISRQIDPNELYDVYCYDETAGPKKNCSKAFSLKPTVAPHKHTRPEEPTIIQDFEEITDMVPSYSTPTEEAVAEGPDVETTPTGESETSVAPTSIPAGIDFIPGSGMELPEQDNVSTTISTPEEMSTPHKEDKVDHEDYDQTESPKNNSRFFKPNEDANNKGGSDSNWLVIILVIVAVAAILLLCVAVAKRKSWCGRKQTLIITKDMGEGNGAAAASGSQNQEMVTLMSKEKVQENGNTEEFTVITLEESSDKEQLA